jgi:hypothetical protein
VLETVRGFLHLCGPRRLSKLLEQRSLELSASKGPYVLFGDETAFAVGSNVRADLVQR